MRCTFARFIARPPFLEALRGRSDLDLALLPGEAVNDSGSFIDDLSFETLTAEVPVPLRLSKTFVDAAEAVPA